MSLGKRRPSSSSPSAESKVESASENREGLSSNVNVSVLQTGPSLNFNRHHPRPPLLQHPSIFSRGSNSQFSRKPSLLLTLPPSSSGMTRESVLSSSSTTPLPPSLPNELKRSILAFADTQTLGRCCRVNLALLEIASELLYRDVEVDGFERLERMFCTKKAHSSAQVDNSLSLHRIKTFTFLADAWPSYEDQPKLLLDRQHHRLVELDVLTIKPPNPIPGRPNHELNARSLLLPFDPTSFNFVVPSSFGEAYCNLRLSTWEAGSPALPISSPSWTRLSSLRLVNSASQYPFVFPSPSWTTTFEVSDPFSAKGRPSNTLFQIGLTLTGEEEEDFSDGVLQFATVVVQSEEEKTRVDAFLRRSWGLGEDRMKDISLVVRKVAF